MFLYVSVMPFLAINFCQYDASRMAVLIAHTHMSNTTHRPSLSSSVKVTPEPMLKVQVTEDAAAETPPADALQEGGLDGSARRCTFLDLALALAAGVDASGAGTLFKAARAGLAERDASVQKKAYKVGPVAGGRRG